MFTPALFCLARSVMPDSFESFSEAQDVNSISLICWNVSSAEVMPRINQNPDALLASGAAAGVAAGDILILFEQVSVVHSKSGLLIQSCFADPVD